MGATLVARGERHRLLGAHHLGGGIGAQRRVGGAPLRPRVGVRAVPLPGAQRGQRDAALPKGAPARAHKGRKAPTDSTNTDFDAARRNYVAPDYLSAQSERLQRALGASLSANLPLSTEDLF